MQPITSLSDLHALYGTPKEAATRKVTSGLTPSYRAWIGRSRFCILSTIGPDGTDGSPRGDDGPVIKVLDDHTIALPDWRGNDRIDTLRNIVRDGRISLLFLIPGSSNAMRINGRAVVTADKGLINQFDQRAERPRSVIIIQIAEVYSQCARAIMRSALWTSGDQSAGLPTVGQMLTEITDGAFDGTTYDAEWPDRAKNTMW